ncbi:unnamed protein product [Rotaria sp. Silwood2]|nr:unnamed protein product [Rotaria sp. Silwood2]CAF4263528.1 unnamed protein product [Rotaria sp. Silwood2]
MLHYSLKGIRYSRFGSKLVGNIEILFRLSGTKFLEAAGKRGLDDVKNNVIKKVWCRIEMKLTEGLELTQKWLKEINRTSNVNSSNFFSFNS